MRNVRKYYFYYHVKTGLAYCHIPKVASLTWNLRFKELAAPKLLRADQSQVRSHFKLPVKWTSRDVLSNLNSGNVTSFVFFRHPLSRLASFYRHKVCFRYI